MTNVHLGKFYDLLHTLPAVIIWTLANYCKYIKRISSKTLQFNFSNILLLQFWKYNKVYNIMLLTMRKFFKDLNWIMAGFHITEFTFL